MSDVDTDPDTRVRCVDCGNRQRVPAVGMACVRPRAAGLRIVPRADHLPLGFDLATIRQHCPAFVPLKEKAYARPGR